jgi:hypothetical protein
MAFLSPFGFRKSATGGGGDNPVTGGLLFDLDARYATYNDAGTTLATDGQTIQEWTTNDGGSHTFEQLVAIDKPTWHSSGAAFNNQPYVSFTGGTGSLNTHLIAPYDASFLLQDQTIFFVGRNTDSVNNDTFDHFFMFGYGVDEGYKLFINTNGAGVEYAAGDWSADNVIASQTSEQSYIYQMRYDQSPLTINLRLDNLAQETDTILGPSIVYTDTIANTTGFILGAGYSTGSMSRELSCEITRLIIYNRYLDDTERDDVMNYLNDLYATH